MKTVQRHAVAVAVSICFLGGSSTHATNPPAGVVAWGYNNYGQTNVPFGLTNAVAVSAGGSYSLALTDDHRVIVWGGGGPQNVPSDLTNVVAVAGGSSHGVALKTGGQVVVWGSTGNGQGNIPFGLTDVQAIAAGGTHSLALKSNGTVVAWGGNGARQCDVPPGLSNVVRIAAGFYHSLALKSDGTAVAWGENTYSQTNVPVWLTNVVAVACGAFHNLALRADSTVVGWGDNYSGQATGTPSELPAYSSTGVVAITGLPLTNVAAIAGGWDHSVALKLDGSVVTWGDGSEGQTNVPASFKTAFAIAAGKYHNVVITPAPVIILQPPPAVCAREGANTNVTVGVWSVTQWTAQWSRNGIPIGGANGTVLHIENFGLSKAGSYSVIVSNEYGSATASSVVRLVDSPVVLVAGADIGGGTVVRVDSAQIGMSSTFGTNANIYYTLDGAAPDFTAMPYLAPFTLTNSATIRAIAYNAAYTDSVEAAPIIVQVWPTYPFSTSTPGGGSVSKFPAPYSGGNRYVSNTVVTLTATPSSGWAFLRWTGDSTAITNVITVLADRPRAMQALFGTSFDLFTNGNGQVLLNPPSEPYPFGSSVQLTALPATDYYFFGWAGGASGFDNPLSYTVTNTAGITANFGVLKSNQVSLTVLPSGNGTVAVSPHKNVYTNGESVTLTALPATNHHFTSWSGDASGNLNPAPLTLSSSKVITANFVPGPATNPPVITQPPLSRTLSAGGNALLSFQLTGDGPFSYQWRFNGSPISAATYPTLALSSVTPAQAGRYDMVVIGPGGTATSAPASVALFGLEMALGSGQPQPLLTLDCAPGTSFRLEHSWNLSPTNWNLLAPVTLSGSRLYYLDSLDTNFFRRFYRAVPQ